MIVSLIKTSLHKGPFSASFQNRRFNHKNKRGWEVLKESFDRAKPGPHQNRRFNHKNKQSLFLSTKLVLSTKACFICQSLFLSTKACDCKPHKKRPHTKDLFPHPSRKRRFYRKNKQSLFLSTTLTSPIQSL